MNNTETPSRAAPLSLSQSEDLWARAIGVIPLGTQTYSKAPAQHVDGVAPKFLVRGQGSRVWDLDGNEYLDYMLGLGPAILGHADPEVNQAVIEAVAAGPALSLPHPLETEVAELLVEVYPCAEMVRFGKNGSDATTAAVRLARAHTGRDLVAACGYHGWHDWYIGSTGRDLGVPAAVKALTLRFEYNDLASLDRLFADHPGQIAGVIMEPVEFDPPAAGFLEGVRERCRHHGALLIFDEIITGFRLALGGAQEYFGVVPDLACVGKAMGNGLPISAVVGRADVMALFDDVFFSSTFGGETVSLAASRATIKALIARQGVAHIQRMGTRLLTEYRELVRRLGAEDITTMIGYPFWPQYVFRDATGKPSLAVRSLFQQEIVRRGVLSRNGMFISVAHTDRDVDRTLQVFGEALEVVAEAVRRDKVDQWLDGAVIQPVIREKRDRS